ncbi:syntaxin-5 [Drosophila grimshawi]|uniref:GH10314 n=1 Tax=Drosophila grimshawi TaxID=7222 RepID=B4JAB8_DROGR|nr:syntaxin-5 [Drosophila grimshawi]EDW03789.1 GH10314 [Drosophila grimshawi]
MQTRRRHQQTDQQEYSSNYSVPNTSLQQNQQQHQEQQHSLIQLGQQQQQQPVLYVTQQPVLEAAINIGEPQSISGDVDADDKYDKAARQWNLFSGISSRSGQALRTFIQQPLCAAAAVVTGNHSTQGYNKVDNNNSSSSNYYEKNVYSFGGAQPERGNFDLEQEEQPEVFIMAARDRTGEFANAIRSLQSRNITRAVNIRDPRKAKQVQSYSEFMMVARFIGKNIASTYAKLEKLTMLAKKKSLFDDRPQEIQELTYIIKGDLNALNQQIAKLQDISKDQRRTTNGKHLVSHSSNMVLALQSKLASMSTDFKQILEVRTENLKHQKTRRDHFSQGPGPLAAHTVSPSTAKQGSLLLSEENQAVSIDMMGGSDTTPLLGPPARLQQQQQQLAIYDESDTYVQQRAETMQNIESTIVELGGIFQQLAHMVKEQEEIVERIDTNVADAELNIEAAHGEILKYFQSVSKNRWLMIKIFGVLIFFFLFFVVFMS